MDRPAVALVYGEDAIAGGKKRRLTTVKYRMQREISAACLPPEGQRQGTALYPEAVIFPGWIACIPLLKVGVGDDVCLSGIALRQGLRKRHCRLAEGLRRGG